MKLIPYLMFGGNCEDALNTYQAIFDGKIEMLTRYGDHMPDAKEKIMHARLIFGENTLMFSDAMPGAEMVIGSNIDLSIGLTDDEQTHTIFNKLAEGGTVKMPLEKQFWGALYGQVTDKFGIDWMLNSETAPQKPEVTKKVTGIGGVFFKCEDTKMMNDWYVNTLGLPKGAYGTTFEWLDAEDSAKKGSTSWCTFPQTSDYFDPSKKEFMINYCVADLEALVAQLKADGVTIVDEMATYDYGKFIHILDPEGNKIELWEPADE